MVPHTTTYLSVTGQGAPIAGDWFAIPDNGRTHVPLLISLSAGTGTWIVEGRNGPNDATVELDTGTASEAVSVARFAQMRVRLSAASGATFRATGDKPMRPI